MFLPFTEEAVVLAGDADVLWDAISVGWAVFPATLWRNEDRPGAEEEHFDQEARGQENHLHKVAAFQRTFASSFKNPFRI